MCVRVRRGESILAKGGRRERRLVREIVFRGNEFFGRYYIGGGERADGE